MIAAECGRRKTGSQEITESRMNAAMQRLEKAAQKILSKPDQGSLNIEGKPVLNAELDSLRIENQLLRQELLELTAAYNSVKQATETVSGRLDKTIENISLMLEQ